MIRVFAMLALGVVFIVCACVLAGLFIGERSRRRRIKKSIGWRTSAADHPRARSLLRIYLNMVAKHGPDSEEARAFRFGAAQMVPANDGTSDDSHNDSADLREFNKEADLIDETWRKLHS
jgi:hypothetical protein